MIDIKDRVQSAAAAAKITTAEAAAAFIKDGMNVGVSGFTPSGYPKAVPLALAERAKAGEKIKINLWTGASVGPEIDQALTEAGVIDRRLPYQTNDTLRKAINSGVVKYTDLHLSHVAQMARYGFFYGNQDADIAIVEACLVKDLGNGQIGIVPTTSMGNSSSFVQTAKQVIIEVNTSQPVELEGMHDSYVPMDPPNRKAIPVERPEDIIGTPYIPCSLDKVIAIVPCDITDKVLGLGSINETSAAMVANIVAFFI